MSMILASGTSVLAQEDLDSSSHKLFQKFNQLSEASLSNEPNPFASPYVFIEQETAQQLTNLKSNADAFSDLKGQWSVSFDLNHFGLSENQISFDPQLNSSRDVSYDWELGTSLVSPDQTSRFYVNYGNRKVPISISFDDDALSVPAISKSGMSLGFEQQFSESWAVSISYLKTEHELGAITNSGLTTHQLDYLFDFDGSNRLETVNFSPLSHDFTRSNLLDDISAIQIKVSRQMSDDLLLSARVSQQSSELFGDFTSTNLTLEDETRYQSQQLALEGRYNLNDSWSLDANLEHQVGQFNVGSYQNMNNFDSLNMTTLDIGVQYQSDWDQVGVVIRIDLMNLLGVDYGQEGYLGLDQNGLKPFSFDSPKYIKVSGSINF